MKFAALLFVFATAHCDAPEIPTPAREVPVERSEVGRVCDRLRDLECKAGEPTPEGATCEEVISNAAAEGIDLVGDVDCVEAATSCDAADHC